MIKEKQAIRTQNFNQEKLEDFSYKSDQIERDNYEINQNYYSKEDELLNKIETIFGENKDLRNLTYNHETNIYYK